MTGLTVFISSTFSDLEDHRLELFHRLRGYGYAVERMEDFSSSGRPPLNTCLEAIERSDLSVMFLGYRYGSYVSDHVSYTEAEYEHAQALGHPIYAYVRSRFDEGLAASTEDSQAKRQLRALRTTLETELVTAHAKFSTPDDLASRAVADIEEWGATPISRPSFGTPLLAIEDAVAYASRRVMREQGRFLAPRVMLVDLSAAHLSKTPPPRASRLTAKLLKIKHELEEKGHSVFLFTGMAVVAARAEDRLKLRLDELRGDPNAVLVCFAKDEDDLALLDRLRDVGRTRFLWYRDAPPADISDLQHVEQWTGDELSSCRVAEAVEEIVDRHIGEVILRAIPLRA